MGPLLGSRPLVSVVLASYNHEAFVERAVRSVLEQDVGPVELLVVDDGSPDKTADVVAGIHDPRVRLVPLRENRRYHPRNLALEMVRGKYVAFQNSDDEWAPGKLRAQLAQLEANRTAVASFTNVATIDADSKVVTGSYLEGVFDLRARPRHEWLRRFFEKGNCLCVTTALVRRDAIEKVGRFRGSLMLWSDLDVWVRLAAMGELLTLDQPLTRMRVLPGHNLSTPTPEKVRGATIENIAILERYVSPPILEQLRAIFPEQLQGAKTPATLLAGLVQHAWKFGAAHQLFADGVAARLLDDAQVREEIVQTYGVAFIHEFITRRRQIEVRIVPKDA